LLGERLPLLHPSERFWGRQILVPLGYALQPALPESVLAEALGLDAEEIVLVRSEDTQIISQTALQPVSRSGIRLALGEGLCWTRTTITCAFRRPIAAGWAGCAGRTGAMRSSITMPVPSHWHPRSLCSSKALPQTGRSFTLGLCCTCCTCSVTAKSRRRPN